ncbi:MAG: IS1634 family transposase [Actinomycetota bacterium]
MYIRRTTKSVRGRAYHTYLLVESVLTERGPRQRTLCSLGSTPPAPPADWPGLVRELEAAQSGQLPLTDPSPSLVGLLHRRPTLTTMAAPDEPRVPPPSDEEPVAVRPGRVRVEQAREAGPVHVGHQFWLRLGIDEVLSQAGFSEPACRLTELMTLNRLIAPRSEHAMPDWLAHTALGDILGIDPTAVGDDALYRHLDRLHPKRGAIEAALAKREEELFNLDGTVYLYDLTSSYFEGQCLANPQAKRGHSKDHRPDCKQVVVGLVVDREGFPKAHEVFEGNRSEGTTLGEMLERLTAHVGPAATVVVDRGMSSAANLQEIREHGFHYMVASRQGERTEHLEEFEDEGGWQELERPVSPTNPFQHKSQVRIKRGPGGEEPVLVLCRSEGREEKDRAIRTTQEKRFLTSLTKLQARVSTGRLKAAGKIQQAIGRLKERYPRVARFYEITYPDESGQLRWQVDEAKKKRAEELDGSYLLKTSRTDLTAEEIWATYILLTRVEAAFRAMKSPLAERPIFHQLERRVQTHIFLCVLAYHLLIAIEKTCRDRGLHTSWATLRDQLNSHQVVTLVLPTVDGRTLTIRKGTTPEPEHRATYRILGIPEEPMRPVKTWRIDDL